MPRMVGPGPDGKPAAEGAETLATVILKMFSTVKTQRAFRPSSRATHARAHDKEISFALVPMEEEEGAAARTGRRSSRRST